MIASPKRMVIWSVNLHARLSVSLIMLVPLRSAPSVFPVMEVELLILHGLSLHGGAMLMSSDAKSTGEAKIKLCKAISETISVDKYNA